MTYMKMAFIGPDNSLTYQDSVIRLSDLTTIPFVEENTDYVEYLLWVEQGNNPIEFDVDLLQNN